MPLTTPKIIVIGLDGASLKLIKPWIDQGFLPHLQEIINDGVHGELRSVTPPMSPPAWTSFMTGQNPGKHGIFDFTGFKPGSYSLEFFNAGKRCSQSLWGILSQHKLRVGVVNVPMTYPPEEVNGFLVSGMEAPGVQADFTYPASLYKEIRQATGEEYDIHGDYWTNKSPEAYLDIVIKTMDNQARAVKYLLSKYPCDFFMAVFGSTDRMQHFYWKYIDPEHPHYSKREADLYGEAILKVYQQADRIMGEYLALVPDPKTVLVVSDHGCGPAKKIVYLNQWLANQGYLAWKEEKSHLKKALLEHAYLQLRKYSPRWFKDLMKARFPDLREGVESKLTLGRIDFSRTKALAMGVESTTIYLNTKDRFPQGTICSEKEYRQVCDALITGISQIRDPDTGLAIVDKIFKREQIYHGDQLANAPDLVVIWKNHEYISRLHYNHQSQTEIVSKQLKAGVMGKLMALELTGCHRPEGLFMAKGFGIKTKAFLEKAKLIDIFPTILYYLGLPIPDDVDGQILTDIFRPDFLANHPPASFRHSKQQIVQENTYQENEKKVMAERLRQLGYLE